MASGIREATLVEDEELKADGKKRKFKPLQAMRKLFSKGRRKAKDDASPVSVVAIKARSTNTLQEDDDDDGGFRNRQSQSRLLGGTRSISEDSVFSPERETTNLQTLKQRAVSEESVPRTALQAELYTKISERRSQYSDEDDGLPHSPTPPSVTTADIIMCGSLKPLPAGGKSISRESDKSLISTDGSETEDDLFKSPLKSAEALNLSWKEKPLESEMTIDFDKLGSTELLKSKHAKDKISVKPRKGKTTRQSRKKQNQLFYSLPSLNEESPDKGHSQDESHGSSPDLTSETVDDVFESKPSHVSPVDKANESEKLQKEERTISSPQKPSRRPKSVSSASLPSEHLSKPEVLRSSLKRLEAAGISEAATKNGVEITKENDKRGSSGERREDQEEIEAGGIGASLTLPPSPLTSDSGEKKSSSPFVSSVLTSSYSSPSSSITKMKSSEMTTSHGRCSVTTDFAENLSFSDQPLRSSSLKSGTCTRLKKDEVSGLSSAISLIPSTSDVSPCVSSPAEAKKESPSLKVSPTLSLSPKEDYKMKRQVRSKTLPQPVSKEEQFSFRVQRAASHREEVTVASQAASPEVLPKHHFLKPVRSDSQSALLKERVVESASTNKPEWITLAKKRMDEKREEQTSSAVEVKDPTSSKQKIEDETGSPGSKVQPMSDPAMSAMSSTGSVSSIASRMEKMPGPTQVPSRDLSQKASVAISAAALSSRGTSIKTVAGKPESSVTTTSELSPSISVGRSFFAASGRPASIAKQKGKGEEKKEVKEEAKESTASKDSLKLKAQTTNSLSSTSVTPPAWSSVVGFSGNRSQQSSMQSVASASTTTARPEAKASPAKSSFLTKSSNLESKEEHAELKQDIPAWRANLGQRKKDVGATSDIKIELIEISSNTRE
ncbi:LOW QUALITY PROTEIN: mucin-5AC-like [Pomacea canaliculata]|uniref:LOW QUALITY PROTEIN: mucin-5AC-like n=1 Tax=Pomacea canaliculata TaxID=400727 RepID=UPI000D72DCA2|nr:LOW QUALITY PROTEIN: mucin-5AC-like [Pomacea canaliculata]